MEGFEVTVVWVNCPIRSVNLLLHLLLHFI